MDFGTQVQTAGQLSEQGIIFFPTGISNLMQPVLGFIAKKFGLKYQIHFLLCPSVEQITILAVVQVIVFSDARSHMSNTYLKENKKEQDADIAVTSVCIRFYVHEAYKQICFHSFMRLSLPSLSLLSLSLLFLSISLATFPVHLAIFLSLSLIFSLFLSTFVLHFPSHP